MAEEQESALQLPPSAAPEAEVPTEVSPETATPEPPSSAAVSPGTEEPVGDTKKKIDILLKAVGDTPIMKTKKWAVERTRTIQGLIDFIKKFLKLVASEQLVSRVPLPCAVEELRDAQSFLHEFELQISAYTRPLNNMSLNCRNPQYIVYHYTTNSWLNLPSIPRFLAAQRVGIPTPLFLRFIYVNQSFAPSPDQEVGTLYECFGSDGKLVLHYCKSQAWG